MDDRTEDGRTGRRDGWTTGPRTECFLSLRGLLTPKLPCVFSLFHVDTGPTGSAGPDPPPPPLTPPHAPPHTKHFPPGHTPPPPPPPPHTHTHTHTDISYQQAAPPPTPPPPRRPSVMSAANLAAPQKPIKKQRCCGCQHQESNHIPGNGA